ncbi:hypothetical protein ACHWQZ_G000386 [Mnemiopsis leidyi]
MNSGMGDLDCWERLEKLKLTVKERKIFNHTRKMLNDKALNNIDSTVPLDLGLECPSQFHSSGKEVILNSIRRLVLDQSCQIVEPPTKTCQQQHIITALGEFMYQLADRPPVPGLTPPTSKSLLDGGKMEYAFDADPRCKPCRTYRKAKVSKNSNWISETLTGSHSGQQYSTKLLNKDLYKVIMTVLSRVLKTLNTHANVLLALETIFLMCLDQLKSLVTATPRSLTCSTGKSVSSSDTL